MIHRLTSTIASLGMLLQAALPGVALAACCCAPVGGDAGTCCSTSSDSISRNGGCCSQRQADGDLINQNHSCCPNTSRDADANGGHACSDDACALASCVCSSRAPLLSSRAVLPDLSDAPAFAFASADPFSRQVMDLPASALLAPAPPSLRSPRELLQRYCVWLN